MILNSFDQIVSTLMGNVQYANKMLVYAENHNQVTSSFNPFFNIWNSLEIISRLKIFFICSYLNFSMMSSQYLEGNHLQRYYLVKCLTVLVLKKNHCLERVLYSRYDLFSLLKINVLICRVSPIIM